LIQFRPLVLGLLLALPAAFALGAVPAVEREALIALYESTSGPEWTFQTDWRNPEDTDFNSVGTECAWIGIICDLALPALTILSLPANQLRGEVPEEITHLSHLLMCST